MFSKCSLGGSVAVLALLLAVSAGSHPAMAIGTADDPPGALNEGAGQLIGAYEEARLSLGYQWLESARDTAFLPSPRGALFRSLVLPGWGQVYNRQPLKVPVIIAGLGGLAGATIYSNNRTVVFRRAALWLDCTADPPLTDPAFCTDLDRLEAAHQRAEALASRTLTADAAREIRDRFRRQRDIFALLTVLAYGLQALDAYVAAELADFDVGEDLAIGLADTGPGIAVRWTF